MRNAALLLSTLMLPLPCSALAQKAKHTSKKVTAPIHSSRIKAGPKAAPIPAGLIALEDEIDLGEIEGTEPQRLAVRLKNNGKVPVKLTGVQPACGCTAMDPSQGQKTLQPGDVHQVDLVFNPEGIHGRVIKTVTFNTDQPGRPSFIVKFKADVKGIAMAQPVVLVLDAPEGGDPTKAPFRLVPVTRGLEPDHFEVEDRAAPLEIAFERSQGGEVKGIVTMDPKKYKGEPNPGQRRTRITYFDKSGNKDVFSAVWTVRPAIWSAPASLQFTVQAGRPLDETVSRVILVGSSVFVVNRVDSDLPGVNVVAVPPAQGDNPTMLRFKLEGSLVAGAYRGKLVFHTSKQGRSIFEVPYIIEAR